jgi:hypothetical protein
MFRLIKRLPWIAAGGAAMWFFDPERGRERRIIAQHKLSELTGRGESDPRLDASAPGLPATTPGVQAES